MWKRLHSLALCLAVALGAAPVSPDAYIAHIKVLASDEYRGRGTGTPGLEMAAEYIANQFEAAGIAAPDGQRFQPFEVTTNAKLGEQNSLSWHGESGAGSAEFPDQFIPVNFSSAGSFTGPVVFVGYGITAAEYHYDDYAGLDVAGKFVVVLRHEPQEHDASSVFAGAVYTQHSELFAKAVNAKLHGALGVILVNDRANHGGDAGDLQEFQESAGPNNAGIPFLQVQPRIAEQWIASTGQDVAEIIHEIDGDLTPRSFVIPNLTVTAAIDVTREVKTVRNVLGYIPGETDEHIVVGAHYDHLGLGEQFSLAPSMVGTIHPGADDNASGTSGLIELGKWLKTQPTHRRGVLLIAFAGEELGLLGSSYYANHPVLPLADAVAMLNMDMIGRPKAGKLYIGGVGTGDTLRATVEDALPAEGLHIEFSDTTGYGSSDHTSFTAKQVPVLFFFSGLHADYHKPSDTWDKIDAVGGAHVVDLVAGITTRLADAPARPKFVRVLADPHSAQAAGDSNGGGGGYGPLFGSIPDFAEIPEGVRFADIRPDTPAAKAGLRAGDILIEFDGHRMENLYDFTYALRAKKPGDVVEVKVLRDGQTVTASVTLETR